MKLALGISLAANTVATGVVADCLEPNFWFDALQRAPLVVNADCSFANAGKWTNDHSGSPAIRVSEKLVAQVVSRHVCGIQMSVLVSDCKTRETHRYVGQLCGRQQLSIPTHYADCLIDRDGLLDLNDRSTLESVAVAAIQNSVRRAPEGEDKYWISEAPAWRQIDPLCGCEE